MARMGKPDRQVLRNEILGMWLFAPRGPHSDNPTYQDLARQQIPEHPIARRSNPTVMGDVTAGQRFGSGGPRTSIPYF
jgi:hypothetical protein